ncbi:MAG: hypothetical protein AAFV86_14175 [Pseudomonadota bacterium]
MEGMIGEILFGIDGMRGTGEDGGDSHDRFANVSPWGEREGQGGQVDFDADGFFDGML